MTLGTSIDSVEIERVTRPILIEDHVRARDAEKRNVGGHKIISLNTVLFEWKKEDGDGGDN